MACAVSATTRCALPALCTLVEGSANNFHGCPEQIVELFRVAGYKFYIKSV
jgi:hypothetical protein